MHSSRVNFLLLIIVALASLGIGLVVGLRLDQPKAVAVSDSLLRGTGDRFTRPLLLTDFGNTDSDPSFNSLKSTVEAEIKHLQAEGKISQMSVYYRAGGAQMLINDELKYYPASLSKVPLMMAFYKLAEHDPSILERRGELDIDSVPPNHQEITPSQYPKAGQEYSVQELIDMMIKYSDNIGFETLINDPDALGEVESMLKDLQLDYPYKQNMARDVLTAREYSRFFRVLRNATYLNKDFSEKALDLLSQTDYNNGIVAGVDQGVAITHKYGLDTQLDPVSGAVIERQLHDCGLVYTSNPYLICIMTKSKAAKLSDTESAVANVSRIIYQAGAKK